MSENTSQKTKVEIFGDSYTIKGADSEKHVRQVADILNRKMYEVYNRNQRLSTTHVAILAGLNLAEELQKLQEEYEDLVKLLEEDK